MDVAREVAELKQAITENSYADQLRGSLTIDMTAYHQLCDNLRRLAQFWQHSELVDKTIIHIIYETITITWYQAVSTNFEELQRQQLFEMYAELDNLFENCLT